MSKKLEEVFECLKVLEDCANVCGDYSHKVEPIKQALLELQSIKESNPSEALKILEEVKYAPSFMGGNERYRTYLGSDKLYIKDINIIEQALQHLVAIENSNHNEALECVNELWQDINVENDFRNDFKHLKTIEQALLKSDKYKQALQTIINKFIWLEPNGEIRVGRFGDVEIPLEDDDFESSKEIDNLKEVLKCQKN